MYGRSMLKDQSPFKSGLHLRGVILPILQLCGSTEWRTRPQTMNPVKVFNTTIIPIIQRSELSFSVVAGNSLDYNTPCFVLFGTDPSLSLLYMALFHATSHHQLSTGIPHVSPWLSLAMKDSFIHMLHLNLHLHQTHPLQPLSISFVIAGMNSDHALASEAHF